MRTEVTYIIWHGICKGFPGGSAVKNLPATQEMRVRSLGQEDALGKEMATHSSILAWKISWTEEPDRLQRAAKSWTRLSKSAAAAAALHISS